MVPFLMKVLLFDGLVSEFFAILFSILGLTLFNHFFSTWLKRKINLNAWFLVGFLASIAVIILSDYYSSFVSISAFSRSVFNTITDHPFLAVLPLVLATIMYYINRNFLLNNLYLEDNQKESSGKNAATNIPYLNQFGMAGELAALEIKLILRNKRPRSILIMQVVLMFYGLLVYGKIGDTESMMLSIGFMMTGLSIINYGQFMFGWQSAHFDGILANRISYEDFIKSKFVLFTLFSILILVLNIPYVYFGWKVLLTHTMLYLWNLGVSSLIVLAFANWNYKYIDLSKGSYFTWQGLGASQWIMGIPLFALPMFIYFLINLMFNSLTSILFMGFIGLIFILMRPFWIRMLTNKFSQKRYIIAEGFRDH
jgi:hypothetical protein